MVAASAQKIAATVVGAGPAGLAVVGNLLAQKVSRVLWVDAWGFSSGRLNRAYREVPSNTKVSLFVQFAEALDPFRKIINDTSTPNAVTKLKAMKQDQGCSIANAADMCRMLTDGLLKDSRVEHVSGTVDAAAWQSGKWDVQARGDTNSSSGSTVQQISTELLVLCGGSHPRSAPLPDNCKSLQEIHLDTALKPSALRTMLSSSDESTIAVIGASHSAILALLNLYKLATSTHRKLRIKWFARSKLLYAVPMEGWILYDNTGLKGEAATWAKEHLEDDEISNPHVSNIIEKISLAPGESFTASTRLSECSHIVQAIGYDPNPSPAISVDGKPSHLTSNPHSGAFKDTDGRTLPNLYGAGIAWPETVTDPQGNVESAVGMFKFMKYTKRVVPEWVRCVQHPEKPVC